MSDLVTDTHAAIWYFSNSPEMPVSARQAINNVVARGNIVILPTISIVEIVYLIEKNCLANQTLSRLMQYLSLPNSNFVTQDLTPEIAQTL